MGKKQKRFILILVGLFFLTGCSESRIRDILEETERGMSGQPLAEGAVNVGIMAREGKYYDLEKEENPYFFPDGMIQKEYEGYFVPPSNNEIRQSICLNIHLIFQGKSGSLYSLELDDLQPTDDPMDYIAATSRHLGYFYVAEDTIYRLGRKTLRIHNPVACRVFETARLIQLIQRINQNDSTLLLEQNIVCNEAGTDDFADENGWHEYVEIDGDRRIFHLYNDYVSGTRQYEQMVWEKGKGITYYLSGSGNKVMHIELNYRDQIEKQG